MASFSQNIMAFDPAGSDDDFTSDSFEDSRVEMKATGHNLVGYDFFILYFYYAFSLPSFIL